MRSRSRDRQKIWFVTVTEKKVGIDTVQEYGKPVMKKMAVSSGTNMPGQVSAGLVVDYDREITSYDKTLRGVIREGDAVLWARMDTRRLRRRITAYLRFFPLKKVMWTFLGLKRSGRLNENHSRYF